MGETRLGIIGMSEGNGHPFSFSAIVNGYSEPDLAESGWPMIHDYVRSRDPSDFGINGLKVTHAWTQDERVTDRLCRACLIEHPVPEPAAMIGRVDAVIIARDDHECHCDLAMPFLEAGMSVFVDKPLALDAAALRRLLPYLRAGRLMSCSAMRYARELDGAKAGLDGYGELRLVRGAILNSWEKYGVHLLDAVTGVLGRVPQWVLALDAPHMSVAMGMEGGPLIQLDALGEGARVFSLDIFGSKRVSRHEITDNFSMFRRMLGHFATMAAMGRPVIDPGETIGVMRALMAGRVSRAEGRKVYLDEIGI
jgi:predicted dehydrogenase